MPRVIVYFLGGLLGGFLGAYGLCLAVVFCFFQGELDTVQRNSRITGEYEAWHARMVQRPILIVALSAAIICASLCGMAATRGSGRAPMRPTRRLTGDHDDTPLSSEEFERVLQSCLFVRLAERDPAYVQGIIVGRLVESDPVLARRLDRFSPRHMDALWKDLVHKSGIR